MYICSSCWIEHEGETHNKVTSFDYGVGECKLCSGLVVEIDDLMVNTIVELNKKGYRTSFCCSGHIDKEEDEGGLYTYIAFHKNNQMNARTFDELPLQFYYHYDTPRTYMRFMFTQTSKEIFIIFPTRINRMY